MKISEKQKEICKFIEKQAKYWTNTNDIDSPTHWSDMEDEIKKLDMNCKDEQYLQSTMVLLLNFIKKYNFVKSN